MEALPRICIPEGVRPGRVVLGAAPARRLAARRLRHGDEFLAFASDGREYRARVEEASRSSLTAVVSDLVREEPPPARTIEVWCANVRANRMEWAIEKCVEAGVDVFRPVTTERSARGRELSEGRHERWERIAIEAAEQCGRLYLPEIAPVTTFEAALESRQGPLVLANRGGAPLGEAAQGLPSSGSIAVAIGPEGGFSDDEVALAVAAGAVFASLGPNTLRTETAALVAVAAPRAGLGSAGDLAGAGEDGVEHLLRQLPREGVALAGMEGIEQGASVRQGGLG